MAVQYRCHVIQTEITWPNLGFSGFCWISSFSDWFRICGIFLETETSDDVLYVSFNAWDSQVSSYTPVNISFTVPIRKSIDNIWSSAKKPLSGKIDVILFQLLKIAVPCVFSKQKVNKTSWYNNQWEPENGGVEWENEIKAIFNCFRRCFKENIFTRSLQISV